MADNPVVLLLDGERLVVSQDEAFRLMQKAFDREPFSLGMKLRKAYEMAPFVRGSTILTDHEAAALRVLLAAE